MNDFNPGPGWKLGVTGPDSTGGPGLEYIEHVRNDGSYERWFREEPVPPLPTEPGYYMADSTADYTGCVYRLDRDDDGMLLWDDTFGNPQDEDDIRRALPLTRLEPRAVTAKAVLDRVVARGITRDDDSYLEAVRIEFGVES